MTRFPGAPEPKGLGTPHVESLTGYLQRVANAHALPPSNVFVDELLPVFRDRDLYRGHDRDIVRHHARAMNGAGSMPAPRSKLCRNSPVGGTSPASAS